MSRFANRPRFVHVPKPGEWDGVALEKATENFTWLVKDETLAGWMKGVSRERSAISVLVHRWGTSLHVELKIQGPRGYGMVRKPRTIEYVVPATTPGAMSAVAATVQGKAESMLAEIRMEHLRAVLGKDEVQL